LEKINTQQSMAISIEEIQNPILLEATFWRLLARGAVDAKHPYRLCSIATVNEDGKPDTRNVILRECDLANKSLSFHTDIRSGKVAHFKNHAEVCMLFWDPKQSLQLRVYGMAVIHNLDEMAIQKLAALPPQQLQLYGNPTTPGSSLDISILESFQEELIKQNFAWINVEIHSLDALHLGRSGIHTRVRFQYDGVNIIGTSYLKA
jgi:hypothetical protein